MRRRGFLSLATTAVADLFDQTTAFGRLALVHVVMMAGDTLVTVSLAGSLFFSVSPDEAKSKVLAYLLLTIAPFAVVSPLLGPLIDRSAHGRRVLVAIAAGARVALCWSMATHLNSWWLYPEAFAVLVCSKLYGVTRGTLVPEMARTDQLRAHAAGAGAAGWPSDAKSEPESEGFAGFNAQLTLLGTLSGLLGGLVGGGLLKGIGANAVLYAAVVVFAGAFVASLRLRRPTPQSQRAVNLPSQSERDRQLLDPFGGSEVTWGLSAAAAMRFAVGFNSFLLAFGLRRADAGLSWYALSLSLGAAGSLLGLGFVTRVRNRLRETTLLAWSLLSVGVVALACAQHPTLVVQTGLAGWLGVAAAVAQPSFDGLTQRLVPAGAQGRTFARFAVRQQLLWVLGAVLPVAVVLGFRLGDTALGAVMLVVALTYAVGRRRAAHGVAD